jgi:hypothetical protein
MGLRVRLPNPALMLGPPLLALWLATSSSLLKSRSECIKQGGIAVRAEKSGDALG